MTDEDISESNNLNGKREHIITSTISGSIPMKKIKDNDPNKIPLPSSVIVNFTDQDGNRTGPPIDLPVESTSKQLETLVNSLLGHEYAENSIIPYAFYVNNIEIETSLRETLNELNMSSYEEALNISFQPLSVFKVRPVTRCIETMPGHTDAILHISYSPDGRRLASGGGDMTVRFWNVTTALPMHTCSGHKHHVLCTAWAPNGLTFISADRSGDIRCWDPKDGTAKGRVLSGHKKWVTSLSFEPYHKDPNCKRFASSSKDNTVKIWNIMTSNCETTISGHTDSVECVKWGGNGLLYSCSRDRTIKVWEIDGHGRNQQKLIRTLSGHAHRINTLAINCDYALRTGAFELGKQILPDVPSQDLQNMALEKYKTVIGGQGEILVSGSDDFTMFLWKPEESKTPLARLTGHQQLINHIAFSPDGRYFASGSFDKKIKVWCGKTGRFLHTLLGHVGSVYQVAWSADSQYIVSASKDSTSKVWNLRDTKKAMYTLPGHEDEVYALDWSPDGTQVATGSKDRTIKIWHN